MKQGKGVSVCSGIAVGKVFVFGDRSANQYIKAKTVEEETNRLLQACDKAYQQIKTLFEQTQQQLGEEKAAIIEVQLLMLKDEEFIQEVILAINQGQSAPCAVKTTAENMASFFSSLPDTYMKERATDILDISARVIDVLTQAKQVEFPAGKFILLAEDLAPSQTLSFPRDRILAMVTQKGSTTSHTAILAKTLNIPTLVQSDVPLHQMEPNTLFAVDATNQRWYSDPTKQVLESLQQQKMSQNHQKERLEWFRGKKTLTKKGGRISLFANIGSSVDIPAVVQGDAEGVGLMRTEFLYLGRTTPPSEEEQYKTYSYVAKTMGKKPVVLRTLDIGADKQAAYLSMEKEENPALGLRGIRFCLANPPLFYTQLRAIYRASVFGNLHIMFPMVSALWEIQKAKTMCEEVRNQLVTDGYPQNPIPIGVMIETPAAALLSEELAKEVDFFSVGTNDLTQYTLAVDRQNQSLSQYADPSHPALWELLKQIAQSANKRGIWAGVCGELAADPTAIPKLIQLGYSELSVPPGTILEARKQIFESEV